MFVSSQHSKHREQGESYHPSDGASLDQEELARAVDARVTFGRFGSYIAIFLLEFTEGL
jgi:hypothetical protein